jgi:tetratricopeptide (TPR) repeat protein
MSGRADADDLDDALRRVAQRDLGALEEPYRRLRVAVFGVALAVVGDRAAAEDVMHDTFLRVWEKRLGESPTDPAAYRLLAGAYLSAGELDDAGEVVEAGLALAPDDPGLLGAWGSVLEGRGRPDEALATWQRVFELEGDRHVSSLYSRVFQLQRLGRLEEAAAEWEAIVAWLLERGFTVQAEWPMRELAKVRARLEGDR